MSECVTESLDCAKFGDQRLTKRLVTIMDRLTSNPNTSIPAAMDGRAEMEGAYRFFNNPKVTPEAIEAPHISSTLERIRQTDVAVLVQDTTEIDVTRPQQQVVGVGPLTSETRLGALYHPLMGFDAQGLPLGTAWSKCWVRKKITTNRTPAQKREERRLTPIEDKESVRWLEGMRAALDVAKACPQTQCVCVADSEADIYELFAEPRAIDEQRELHLLVRACQDRTLSKGHGELLATVRDTPCLFEYTVELSGRHSKMNAKPKQRHEPREARLAEVEVRALTLTLDPPDRFDRKLPPVTINVVLIEEPNPPAGQKPVQWILITTLPIDDHEKIQRIIHYYEIRWQIEVYFKTLKSGCRIEERYFERWGPLLNCLKVYTIVAWKLLYLCRLSRQCPNVSCEVVFEPSEWKPVYMTVRRSEPPRTPPTLNEIVRMIASLGGYVIRKSTQPGTQTLWLGLQRLNDLSNAWTTFGPDSRTS
jgi:hypothetical protein